MFPKRHTPSRSMDGVSTLATSSPPPSSSQQTENNLINSPSNNNNQKNNFNNIHGLNQNNNFHHQSTISHHHTTSASLDEEIEYFSPNLNGSTVQLAPSPIKNDYRKDPQLSRTTKDGVRSPSLFTKYPSMDAVLMADDNGEAHRTTNKTNSESEIYEKLFEDADDSSLQTTNFSTPTKNNNNNNKRHTTNHSLDVMNMQQTTTTPKLPISTTTNSSTISTPLTPNTFNVQSSPSIFPKSTTSNSTSPFPKVNSANRKRQNESNTSIEHFSTPNAEKISNAQSSSSPNANDTSTMDISDFEQFNADNILKPLKASTAKQLQQLQSSGETTLNDTTMITRQESRHQALFHHYLEEKGDIRSAMLLLNQFHVKQHRMNILNFKLNSINLVANFANAVKSHKLQLELHKSKKTVNALHSKVEELNETVGDLNEEVEQHKSSLASFMQKYYKTVEELQQNQYIQKMQLENIIQLKTREDITVDLLILIASSYIVRKNRTLHRFLKFVFMFLPFNGLIILVAKILTTIGLMLISRRVAIRLGIHAGATNIAYGAIKSVQFSIHVLKTLWNLFHISDRGSSLKKE
ncbi:hypothetical protein FDP41_009798 [Naegleria fowleri]|uniref:Uncharacterized protein n=1 Tax=Naegleria fowleri TaxID=5763 RepID=A0A6A5BAJ6_NAEFO|nr:uncharacterized protein FDP41_009798 [Naegleria fowleri]KAF0972102.1 hypothetical protein FDP41_009798 [Naegleria fowleri]CAG4712949.1 unnamed protein product [Naegleria fowleri]